MDFLPGYSNIPVSPPNSTDIDGQSLFDSEAIEADPAHPIEVSTSKQTTESLAISVIVSVVVLMIVLSWNDLFVDYMRAKYPGPANAVKRRTIHAGIITVFGLLILAIVFKILSSKKTITVTAKPKKDNSTETIPKEPEISEEKKFKIIQVRVPI